MFACASCSTDSVEVLCELVWHVVVDDGLDAFDVQTTSGEISCYKIVGYAITEGL